MARPEALVAPAGPVGAPARPPWWPVTGHLLVRFRRVWVSTTAYALIAPLMYLAGMGLGLGALVDARAGGIGGVPYVAFIAPGLLASTAMMIGVGESSFTVLGGIKWDRTYHGMLATPLRPVDIVVGHLGYLAVRLTIAVTAFFAVAAALGTVRSWWGLLAVPVAVLVGLAVGAPMFAFCAGLDRDLGITAVLRFVITPMMLFAGTFFPVSELPAWIQPVAWVTPLWHATEAARSLTLGLPDAVALLGHLAYLGLWLAVGTWAAVRVLSRRMVV